MDLWKLSQQHAPQLDGRGEIPAILKEERLRKPQAEPRLDRSWGLRHGIHQLETRLKIGCGARELAQSQETSGPVAQQLDQAEGGFRRLRSRRVRLQPCLQRMVGLFQQSEAECVRKHPGS